MQPSDVPPLVAYMAELWSHYRTPGTDEAMMLRVQAWMDVLGDIDPAAVRAAVASMAGREYAPSPGQLREAVTTMAHDGGPTWAEWWAWVLGEAKRASLLLLPGGRLVCPWPEAEGVLMLDDLLDGGVPVGHAELLNVRQGHLRRRWEAHMAGSQRRAVGKPPALAAYLGAQVGRGGEPRRIGSGSGVG